MHKSRRTVALAIMATLALVSLALAGKAKPLIATLLPNQAADGYGVVHDGNERYEHGVSGLTVALSVTGKNATVNTYNSGRKFGLRFDPASPARTAAGLPANVDAEVYLFGINYFGPYESMGIGTTAQVQADLEFRYGAQTYELDYQSLAAMRVSADTWLITSDPNDIPGYPGFTASSQAALRVVRRKSKTTYGAVNMPIRFYVTLK